MELQGCQVGVRRQTTLTTKGQERTCSEDDRRSLEVVAVQLKPVSPMETRSDTSDRDPNHSNVRPGLTRFAPRRFECTE